MNPALLASALVLLALGLAAYPPGLSPLYPLPDEALQVAVPPSLVERGYPPYVSVSRSYLETRFSGSYAQLINSTFTGEGIVDASSGRVIPPEEAWRTVIGRSSSIAVNYVKIALLLSAVLLLAAAAATAPGAGSRAEPVGGYAP